MNLDDDQQRTLRSVLGTLDERDIRYVILRGHEPLPSAVDGSDIDLFVAPASFDEVVGLFQRELEAAESPLAGAVGLAMQGAKHPWEAASLAVGSPRIAASYVRKSLTTADFAARDYVKRTFTDGDLGFDLANHLAYTSTLDESKIRVDPAVEAAMLDRRVERDGLYVPAPPDELAHLVCRGVFDYEGTFPERYRTRCDDLAGRVSSQDRLDEQFRTLLSRLFYDADTLVYDLVCGGEYDAIRQRLRRYTDY
jgi:hypothetical protein